MVLRRLVIANLIAHRVRVGLTVAAIALSVSLVVAVTTGYASAEASAMKFLGQFMGATDAEIARSDDATATFDGSIVEQIQKDPAVKSVSGRLQDTIPLIDKDGMHSGAIGNARVTGIARPEDKAVNLLQMEGDKGGAWFETSTGNVAVVDQVVAERLHLKVGDTFQLPGLTGPLTLKVVGIVHKPAMFAMAIQTIYVPLETLQKFKDHPGQINRVIVSLQSAELTQAFKDRWASKLPLPLKLRTARDARQDMEKNLKGIHALAYLGGAVSMVAALFIVFSALSMGVTERSRTLAMLRAIGAFRSQLAGTVVLEGLILALLGCALGVPLGWGWMKGLEIWRGKEFLFAAGVVISWGGVALGAGGSMLAALVASFLPAFSAMRVSPLEAMAPQAKPSSNRVPLLCAIPGAILLCVDPLLIHTPLLTPTLKFIGHFALGLPAEMAGFFLVAPLFVFVIELLFARVTAILLRVRPALVRQQLSGGIWRAAGTACALMVGLAVLIVMQTEGHSMLAGWRLPDKFPDVFILAPGGITWDQIKLLDNIKGIKKGELMPIAIARPGMPDSPFTALEALALPNETMFIGVDPDLALQMMELEFRDEDGRRASADDQKRFAARAVAELKMGRHLIITDELRQIKGYKLGGKMPLMTTHGSVDYIICGIVWSPGIDVMVNISDLGDQFQQRTASSVFGSLDDARNDFGVSQVHGLAANLDTGVPKEELLKGMNADMRKEAERAASTKPVVGTDWMRLVGMKQMLSKMDLQIADIRRVKYNIQNGFEKMLLMMSTVAFAAMAVAALGVANTIMASIRSRRWQFGILRSIGVTRSQLLRLVLAEAILLGLVGVAMGAACGTEMTLDASGMTKYLAGYIVPLEPPWKIIWIGVTVVMSASLLASLWPAVSVATEEPLALLQAGRAG